MSRIKYIFECKLKFLCSFSIDLIKMHVKGRQRMIETEIKCNIVCCVCDKDCPTIYSIYLVTLCMLSARYSTFLLVTPAMEMRPSLVR